MLLRISGPGSGGHVGLDKSILRVRLCIAKYEETQPVTLASKLVFPSGPPD